MPEHEITHIEMVLVAPAKAGWPGPAVVKRIVMTETEAGLEQALCKEVHTGLLALRGAVGKLIEQVPAPGIYRVYYRDQTGDHEMLAHPGEPFRKSDGDWLTVWIPEDLSPAGPIEVIGYERISDA